MLGGSPRYPSKSRGCIACIVAGLNVIQALFLHQRKWWTLAQLFNDSWDAESFAVVCNSAGKISHSS